VTFTQAAELRGAAVPAAASGAREPGEEPSECSETRSILSGAPRCLSKAGRRQTLREKGKDNPWGSMHCSTAAASHHLEGASLL